METPRNPLFTLLFYLSQGTPVHYGLVSGDSYPLCVSVVQPLRSPSPRGSPELTCGLVEGEGMYSGPFALQCGAHSLQTLSARWSGGRADLMRKLQVLQGIAICI